jgi:alkyl hydroperoxide reductase subunit AhpC
MTELGELERAHEQFAGRGVRIIVVSNDNQKIAQETQADFPHLVVVSDRQQEIAEALQVLHRGVGPGGQDTNAPTTFLVDRGGQVRWFFRPKHYISRLSPAELLKEIDRVQLSAGAEG